MKMEFLLTLGGILAAVQPAQAQDRADLSWMFPDARQYQGNYNIGDCQSFVAVALFESALFRQYGLKIRLSEADLFTRLVVMNKDYYADSRKAIRKIQGSGSFGKRQDISVREEGSMKDAVNYVFAHGVATDATLDYVQFALRYRRYSKQEEQAMGVAAEINRNYAPPQAGNITQWYYNTFVPIFYDPGKHWVEMRTEPTSLRLTEAALLGGPGNIGRLRREREIIQRAVRGFSVESKNFFNAIETVRYWTTKNAYIHACQINNGNKQLRWIKEQLFAGRPVAVEELVAPNFEHGYVIIGFYISNGSIFLRVRDLSNGDTNSVMSQEHLCSFARGISILTPRDFAEAGSGPVYTPEDLRALAASPATEFPRK